MKRLKFFILKDYVCKIDSEDYYLIEKYNWSVVKQGKLLYICRCIGKKTRIYLHIEILGKVDGKVIDHINGNGLDNRRENLRHCTSRENVVNSRPFGKHSKYKGVSKNRSKWEVHIQNKSKSYYLGQFDDEILAAKTYDAFAVNVFGEFARLNFPKEVDNNLFNEKRFEKRKLKSIFRGVCSFKNRWRAYCIRNHLGYFKTELEAAKAYNKYIIENNLDMKLNLIKRG